MELNRNSTMAEENTAETDVKEADDTNDQTGKRGDDKGGTTEEATEPVGSGETGGDASAHPAGKRKVRKAARLSLRVRSPHIYLSLAYFQQ